MIVFRVCKSKYARDLSGHGAEVAGGRWNNKGTPLVYTCDSRALCMAEIAVWTPLGIVPNDYDLVTIQIPDDSIQILNKEDLPDKWKSFPHNESTRKIGDAFQVKGQFLILKVPSAVVQDEYNFLINPTHPDGIKIKIVQIQPFAFDERLFNK
ncbi:MAG: RES superfamily protein [Flavobacteriales bacterium CG_4_9_14_3_um_filter_40_17]|nr:MAG: RES superfamily protein [Flavobacteriales bacterium CG_4_9_14_3_um_filter_40_17]